VCLTWSWFQCMFIVTFPRMLDGSSLFASCPQHYTYIYIYMYMHIYKFATIFFFSSKWCRQVFQGSHFLSLHAKGSNTVNLLVWHQSQLLFIPICVSETLLDYSVLHVFTICWTLLDLSALFTTCFKRPLVLW